MKIINISFTNIHNLKGGPHVISFEEEPLNSAGIIAILGPTGSGKSTILDVITLALFNEIPRFKSKVSRDKITGLGSVITHHTDEASASIIYEIAGNRFKSSWSISKNRNGNFRDYEMTLQNANGKYFDLKRSEIPGKNEEIIGLNYDQFVKSIILSQGEFSKFLKSDKNERGQLLENLTGTAIYSKIGKKAFHKHKEIKAEVEKHKVGLAEIKVLADDERIEILAKTKKYLVEVVELEKTISKSSEALSVKNGIIELQKELSQVEIKSRELGMVSQRLEKELFQLEMHEKLSPLQGEFSNFKLATENKKLTAQNLSNYKIKLTEASGKLQDVIYEMSQLAKLEVSEDNFLKVMSAFESEVNQMDADLKHLTSNGSELRSRINNKQQQYSLPLLERAKPDAALRVLQQQEAELSTTVKQAGLNVNAKMNEVRAKIKEDSADHSNMKDFCELLKMHKENGIKQENAHNNFSELQLRLKEVEPLLQKSKEQMLSLKEIERLLNKQKADAEKIASLEERRGELIEGEPCPLCGSTEHPFSLHQPEKLMSDIEEKIELNRKKIDIEEVAFQKLRADQIKNETKLVGIKKDIDTLRLESQKISDDKQKIKSLNPVFSDDLSEMEKLKSNLWSKLDLFEKSIGALENLQINRELVENYKALAQLLLAYNALKVKRNTKFSGEKPSVVCNQLQEEFANSRNLVAETNKAIQIESKDLERAESLLKSSTANISSKAKLMGISNIETIEQNLLPEKEYFNIREKKEKYIRDESAIKSSFVTVAKKLKAQHQKDKLPQQAYASLNLIIKETEAKRNELNKIIGESQSRIKQDDALLVRRNNKLKSIVLLESELEKWALMNHMIGDAKGHKFANFAQGLTLQNLLVFTNRRLLNLSDRYLLDKPKDDGELRIIDKYQGNTERAVSTLSGGETFLISLALALSLSDMASKNISLESLFIDEGFGTLDQETLDIALDTLEKLQTESQKMVGVISHVEALKERISVQIRLEKNAQGYSKLRIHS